MKTPSSTDKKNGITVELLTGLINGGHAHASFEKATEGLSLKQTGEKPDNLPYSIWQLTEHIRIAQWDILEFSKSPDHQSPKWPDEYWPKETAPADEVAWKKCLEDIKQDRAAFISLLKDTANDIYKPFAHGDGQSLFKEALVLADHASYHIGEIIILRRLLGLWKN